MVIAVAAASSARLLLHWARKRQEQTGEQAPVFSVALALIVGCHSSYWGCGFPLSFEFPQGGRFNITADRSAAGIRRVAVRLSIYTAAFIAEVVRAVSSPSRVVRPKRPIRWGCGGRRPCG